MALPNVTPEQRAKALEKAAQVRKARKELKENIKSGKTDPACNSRIIKVKLTIIFSITRQASECAIIDFLEDSSDEVFHSTKDTSPLRFGAIAEVLLLITHELFKQPQESRDDFHL